MAITLDFNIRQSDNAKDIIFTETTGAYNASDNTGGWGSPNETEADATTATLTVTEPDGTATVIDISSSFPDNDRATEWTIQSDDLGNTADTKHADGLWTFLYTVALPSQGTVTVEQTIFISGSARCCVYGMLAAIDLEDCDCDGSDKARALEAFTYYRALIATAACGNTSKFTDLLTIVNKYCSGTC